MSGIVKYGGGFIVLCVVLAMYGAAKKDGDEADRLRTAVATHSTSTPAVAPTPKLVQGAELVKAYDRNEVAADNVYKGKRLRVVGRIKSIGKDITDDPYVTIGESFNGVNCYFGSDKTGLIATLNKGDPIVFEGDCRGLTMGSVILRDCSIPGGDTLRADHHEAFQTAGAAKSKR